MLRIAAVALFALLSESALALDLSAQAQAEAGPSREMIDASLEWISTGIEIAGVAIIVIGAAVATVVFVHGGFVTVGWPAAYRRYRANLGRGILLGLELLVAADIIGTVAVTPSFENLAILGLIVLIRTFLSFSLEVEIEGRWPWRRAEAEASAPRGATGERF
jgi:uncharacterized membrane protein